MPFLLSQPKILTVSRCIGCILLAHEVSSVAIMKEMHCCLAGLSFML